MKHNYISIPRIWVSEDNLKSFNVSNAELELSSNKKKKNSITHLRNFQ